VKKVKSFVLTLPPALEKQVDFFEKMLYWMIDSSLCWALRHAKFYVHKSEMTLVGSCLKYLKTYMKDYEGENIKVPKEIEDILINISLFCVVWSIGAAMEEVSRKKFKLFIVDLIQGNKDLVEKYDLGLDLLFPHEPRLVRVNIPEKSSIFELCYEK